VRKLRILPTAILDGGFLTVDAYSPGNRRNARRHFPRSDEVVYDLMIDCPAVCLAREAQNDPEDVGTFTLSFRPDDGRCGAEVYLHLFAGHAFHLAKRYQSDLSQAPD